MSGTRHFSVLLVGLLMAVLGLSGGTSAAEEERVAALPLVFPVERTDVKVSACLRVREKTYGADRAPWPRFKHQARASPETALTQTIAAMLDKDESRFGELSHSRPPRDSEAYQKQVSGYFEIMERLKLGDVWGYHGFGDHLVFFMEVDSGGGPFFTRFAFEREETGRLGFLPEGSESLTYQFVAAWFDSAWGPAQGQSPAYCPPSLTARMTHKVRLEDAGRPGEPAPELAFMGRIVTGTDADGEPYIALRDTISTLMTALRSGRPDDFFDGFTERGRTRVGDWYESAQETERRRYFEDVEKHLGQDPFFVIDAEPVFIVYTRPAASGIRALSFLRDESGRFRWANAAYATTIDALFKGRRFLAAASEEPPFASWKIDGPTAPN